jgi:hypothetical protein
MNAEPSTKLLKEDNQFLAHMMLIKFAPTNYCLTPYERKRLEECYKNAFGRKNKKTLK